MLQEKDMELQSFKTKVQTLDAEIRQALVDRDTTKQELSRTKVRLVADFFLRLVTCFFPWL